MKTVLVSYYWYPWNDSGSFRWIHFSETVDIDLVVTCRRPRKGFYDDTMPAGRCKRVLRVGCFAWSFLGGLVLSFVSCFVRADRWIFSSPPETLLVGAWLNARLGRKVYVDMRDRIDRKAQRLKFLTRVYRWFYRRIDNVVVCHSFVDPAKTVIHSGYERVDRKCFVGFDITSPLPPLQRGGIMRGRFKYRDYIRNLERGFVPDFKAKVDRVGRLYGSLSLITVRKLGVPIEQGLFHPDCFSHAVNSWETQGCKMREWLDSV